jgi:DNA polymerase-3 subunit epsilon
MSWQIPLLRIRRLRHRARVRNTALESCWKTPLPSTANDWRQCSFLACDAEMSSLDPNDGELLSLGWISIERGMVQLASAEHHLIQPQHSVGQSATIHNLRDCEFEAAQSPEQVAKRFLKAAAGRVLVFHNAHLDLAFLDRAFRQLYKAPLLLPYADTMGAEHKLLNRHHQVIQSGDLRLQACRERYNLPPCPAHNALQDALATAELLLAQVAKRSGDGELALGDILA